MVHLGFWRSDGCAGHDWFWALFGKGAGYSLLLFITISKKN